MEYVIDATDFLKLSLSKLLQAKVVNLKTQNTYDDG